MNEIDISIVIVSFNTEQITLDCIDSIYKSETDYKYEIILVDNNSKDKTVERIKTAFPDVKLIASDKNLGFSKGNNVGIAKSSGKYVLLLNSDTLLFRDSLDSLLKDVIVKGYNIAGPVLLNKDHTIQRSWFNFPSALKIFLRLTDFYVIFYRLSRTAIFKLFYLGREPAFMVKEITSDLRMDYLTFACILIKKEIIDEIGDLDEGLFFYQEDCEYGLRAFKNNYEFVYCVAAKVIHLGGSSSSKFSWLAFENDIMGLLHIYKKHYPLSKFKQVRSLISLSLTWRISLARLGFYNELKKSGLYNKGNKEGNTNGSLISNYKKLRTKVKNYE